MNELVACDNKWASKSAEHLAQSKLSKANSLPALLHGMLPCTLTIIFAAAQSPQSRPFRAASIPGSVSGPLASLQTWDRIRFAASIGCRPGWNSGMGWNGGLPTRDPEVHFLRETLNQSINHICHSDPFFFSFVCLLASVLLHPPPPKEWSHRSVILSVVQSSNSRMAPRRASRGFGRGSRTSAVDDISASYGMVFSIFHGARYGTLAETLLGFVTLVYPLLELGPEVWSTAFACLSSGSLIVCFLATADRLGH